jgi:hypothetical protein
LTSTPFGIDFASFGNVADPAVWSQVHDEGVEILENLLNIRVPVIAAVKGVSGRDARRRSCCSHAR